MEKIKDEVNKFLKERNWTTQKPADVSKSIVIEAAELLEKFQWNNHLIEDVNKNKQLRQEIIEELADVFIYSAQMADILDVNIEEIVSKKLDKQRIKYPAEVMKSTSGAKKYLEIKKKYRNS